MKLLTPKFWQHRGFLAHILVPFSWLFKLASLIYRIFYAGKAGKVSVPVICVGNLTAGGAGKTPVAIALANYVESPAFLSRGYGGNNFGPLQIDPKIHTAKQVGDEALLLASKYPTWIGKNRYLSALKAIQSDIKILLMDDGLQHLSLHQDCRFVVVDGVYGFGNELIIPAGPMREKIRSGLRHADAVIIIGDDLHHIATKFCGNLPVFRAEFEANQCDLDRIKDKKIIAFTGIGRPQKFFDFLASRSCNVVQCHSFPDHHFYKDYELQSLKLEAAQVNSILITTEKDYVRLPNEFKCHVSMCRITLKFKDPYLIQQFLREKISNVV